MVWKRIGRGLGAGATGALLAHLSAVGLARATGGASELWLKGPHGPPFFSLSLLGGVYYACLGSALTEGAPADRLRGAGRAAAAAFLVLAAPLAVATRVFAWGEGAAPQTLAWFWLVLGAYTAANAAAGFSIGAWPACADRGRRGAGTVGGLAAAWLAVWLGVRLGPGPEEAAEALGLVAPRAAWMTGAVYGGLAAAGMAAAARRKA